MYIPVSGNQLRCDVIVDAINSLAIETTTHELYLDDSPEEFVIRAMNDEGRHSRQCSTFILFDVVCHFYSYEQK